MPKLLPKNELTRIPEETLVNITKPLVEYFVIPSQELKRVSEAALEATNIYTKLADTFYGPANALIKAQLQVSNYLYNLTRILAKFNQINFVIPVPQNDIPEQKRVLIYVQPNEPYNPIKSLPVPHRKQTFSLEQVMIREEGFTLNGEYISGMTIKSQPGKLFELMIRKDLGGIISDELLSKVLGTRRGDYSALSIVINDLKHILKHNKLKINMVRNRAIKEYRTKSITKHIRNPRGRKKARSSDKSD